MDFTKDDLVFTRFKDLVEAKGWEIKMIDEDGLIYIEKDGEEEIKVSLDNLRKEYERLNDESVIVNFVEVIVKTYEELPPWAEVENNIFPSLFPSDFDFDDYISYPVTEEFNMIIVCDSETAKTWINEEQLTTWGIDNETLLKTAYRNLDRVLEQANLEFELYEGKKLATFEVQDNTMKSVLILSKNLKAKVEKEIGWPVLVVIPVRDFCFMFAEADYDFFAERLGGTVIDEFQNSGYPITTEILQCDDEGIQAIARFEPNDDDTE